MFNKFLTKLFEAVISVKTLIRNKQISKRQENNRKLIALISEYIDKHPEMRFIQALWALNIIDRDENGIIDRFSEESDKTLKRIS